MASSRNRAQYTPWTIGAGLVPTTLAAGSGSSGIVVTDTPATYHDGLYTSSRLQAPGSLLNTTQIAFAARIKLGLAITSATEGIFQWGNDATHLFQCYAGNDASVRMRAIIGASTYTSTLGFISGGAGSKVTVCGYANSLTSLLGVSWNGVPFTTAAMPSAPTVTASSFDIGNIPLVVAAPLQGTVMWIVVASVLSDADASALNALGDTPPYSFPWTTTQAPTALLDATITPPRLWLWGSS